MLPIYSHFQLLPLSKMIVSEQANFMFRYHKNTLPLAFDTYCSRPVHAHNTRFSKTNFCLPSIRSKTSEKSMKIIGPKIWSGIDHEIKALPFRKTFSKHLKKQFVNELPKATNKKAKLMKKNEETSTRVSNDSPEGDNGTTSVGLNLSLRGIFGSEDSDTSFHGFDE